MRKLPLRTAILIAVFAWSIVHVAAAAKPNIVFILADDLGIGDLCCYNPKSKIPTPNLDRLATQSMRFTDAHSPSGVCTPTRYGLLTGRYSWRTRLKSGVLWGYSPPLIEPGRLTVAELLRKNGYTTACVGKWHLGLGWQTREPATFGDRPQPAADPALVDYSKPLTGGPLTAGFDYFFGIPASLDMDPYLYVENDRPFAAPTERVDASKPQRQGGNGFWRAGPIGPGFRHDEVLPTITKKAIGWLERQAASRKPFFLYFPLTAPHEPWQPTGEFRGTSGAGAYGDFVTQVDAAVGDLLKRLDELKLSDNTLLIFTSDNGAHWTPEDIEKWGHRSNMHLRGQKSDAWEGGHRVPFLVRWPGKVKAGSTSDQLICHTDFMATVAELIRAKLPVDAAEDSFSYLFTLRGRTPKGARDHLVMHSGNGVFSIRRSNWKLILGLGSGGFSRPANIEPKPGGPTGQLFDLKADPSERNDLFEKDAARVNELSELLEEIKRSARSAPR